MQRETHDFNVSWLLRLESQLIKKLRRLKTIHDTLCLLDNGGRRIISLEP